MTQVVLESCEKGIIAIPKEVLKGCGFSPHEKVIIREGEKFFVVRQSLPQEKTIDPATKKALNRLRIPTGSLAHLATGSGGSGDFDENDID